MQRRRPRPGSLERPVNGRLYRGTWLLVALPLLLAAFTVQRPVPLPSTGTPPAFDRAATLALANDLSTTYPDRVPGTAGALGAAAWFTAQLKPYGFAVEREPFTATIPGLGKRHLVNLVARVPGRSEREIVVAAHRDDTGNGPGAVDNASGTAALVELARVYAQTKPNYTFVFLSTDGGAFGNLGAARFAASSRYSGNVEAVVNLDALGSSGPPRLELAADKPRSPAASLVATVAAAVQLETGRQPTRPSALRQLVDLGFPFNLYDQAPFVARGIPAVTLTAAPDRPLDGFAAARTPIDAAHLVQLGRAAQDALGSLDEGLDLAQGTSSYVYLGARIIPGWAVELVLIAMLVPFLAAVVDLFARCRRRRIRVAPALRSYRSRLGFWAWGGLVFLLFSLGGVWPDGAARPPALTSPAAGHWPAAGLVGLLVLVALGWIVARDRLLPRRPIRPEEELAGYTGALLALSVVALLVVATNPFALVFLLPSLHLWLWLPQVRAESRFVRLAVLLGGFAGFALLLLSFGDRYGLGFDGFWYLAELFALGYAPVAAFAIGLTWLAGAAQLCALAAGRYAPYPAPRERRERGPIREVVRRAVLAERARRRRRASEQARRALEG
jgi:hypothetical protein